MKQIEVGDRVLCDNMQGTVTDWDDDEEKPRIIIRLDNGETRCPIFPGSRVQPL